VLVVGGIKVSFASTQRAQQKKIFFA